MGELSRRTPTMAPSAWRLAADFAPADCDARLLAAGAPLAQFPAWNDSLSSWRLRPLYLVAGEADAPRAFASILSLGPSRSRLGIVRRGPFWFAGEAASREGLWRELAGALDSLGFVAVTFAGPDAATVDAVERLGPTDRSPLFRFPIEDPQALVVPLGITDEATAAGFAPVARRDIRRALAAGYRIESSDDPAALTRAYRIWERVPGRRHANRRGLESYRELLDAGRPNGLVTLFTACLGSLPIQAILVAHDRRTAYYITGGLDREALGDRASPSCLLHFHAMCEARRGGRERYDLGSRSGPVERFKRKFRPVETTFPAPVNLVLDPARYLIARRLLRWLR